MIALAAALPIHLRTLPTLRDHGHSMGGACMQQFLVIGVFLALGAACQRWLALPERAPFHINRVIINFILPAVILLKLPRLPLDGAVWLPMLTAWSAAAMGAALMLALARRQGWDRPLTGAVMLLGLYGNSSYLGFPMVRAFFGDAGMPYAIVFDQLGNFVVLAVFAPMIIARYGEGQEAPSARAMLRRLLLFPPFLALLAGLALNGVQYPGWLQGGLGVLGLLLAPLAMFIVGTQLSWRVPQDLRGPLAWVLGLRLLLLPGLALAGLRLAGFDGLAMQVTVFEVGMPTMVTASIMAMAAGLAPRLCSAAVGLGLCASMLTLPLWHAVLRGVGG